jgi:hypothetical protein
MPSPLGLRHFGLGLFGLVRFGLVRLGAVLFALTGCFITGLGLRFGIFFGRIILRRRFFIG